jgi:hypothetical protein
MRPTARPCEVTPQLQIGGILGPGRGDPSFEEPSVFAGVCRGPIRRVEAMLLLTRRTDGEGRRPGAGPEACLLR